MITSSHDIRFHCSSVQSLYTSTLYIHHCDLKLIVNCMLYPPVVYIMNVCIHIKIVYTCIITEVFRTAKKTTKT